MLGTNKVVVVVVVHQIQDVWQSSGLFAVFESDTLVSCIRGYYSNQGG